MRKSELKEKKANFEAWVATLDERVFDWLRNMDGEQKKLFDHSIESLDEVEKYLIGKYGLEDLRDERNKFAIDGAASYVSSGSVKRTKLIFPRNYESISDEEFLLTES
jgi:hypothetical protein